MRSFGRCLGVELRKLRRTPALLVAVLAPYVVVLLFTIALAHAGTRVLPEGDAGAWAWLLETITTTWAFVFLPVVLALLTALTAAVEREARGFDLLYTLPVSRWTVFWSKQATTMLLLLLSSLLLAVGVVVGGLALRLLRPGLGLDAPIPWRSLVAVTLGQLAACGFVAALHTWIGLVRRDFALPVLAGFLAMVAMVTLGAVDADLQVFLPWSYPVEVARAVAEGQPVGRWAAAGMVGGLAFAAAAGAAFVRREVR